MFIGIEQEDGVRELLPSGSKFTVVTGKGIGGEVFSYDETWDRVCRGGSCYLFASITEAEAFLIDGDSSGRRNLFEKKEQ
jgi:hypothetical protein